MTINYSNLNKITSDVNSYKKNLLIVTKNKKLNDIVELLNLGKTIFGENRVEEAEEKYSIDLRKQFPNFELHLIGPLQSRKTAKALQLFDVIQTLDRKKIVNEIIKVKEKIKNIRTNKYYIQVNIGNEGQKSGVKKEDLLDLYDYATTHGLYVIGLMCIPPNVPDPSEYFKEMNVIKNKINNNLKLSMGMSNDYLIALKEDTDLVRVGSSIFK